MAAIINSVLLSARRAGHYLLINPEILGKMRERGKTLPKLANILQILKMHVFLPV